VRVRVRRRVRLRARARARRRGRDKRITVTSRSRAQTEVRALHPVPKQAEGRAHSFRFLPLTPKKQTCDLTQPTQSTSDSHRPRNPPIPLATPPISLLRNRDAGLGGGMARAQLCEHEPSLPQTRPAPCPPQPATVNAARERSAAQPLSRSANQRISESANQRISESANQT